MSTTAFDAAFDAAFEAGVTPGADQVFPGVVLAAAGLDDRNEVLKVYGRELPSGSSAPLKADAVFWLASCTKLITTIAALQCVEQGLLSLDSPDDVVRAVPSLKDKSYIAGTDAASGEYILAPSTRPITLRQLLTHTSGFGYDFLPKLAAWRASQGEDPRAAALEFDSYAAPPLEHEPGTAFTYGIGIDVAGRVVEHVVGTSLAAYLDARVFAPLGITAAAFDLETRPDLQARLMPMSVRAGPDAPLTPEGPVARGKSAWTQGGAGLHASAPAFLAVLKALLRNDGALLRPDTVELMFTPQLDGAPAASLEETFADPLLAPAFTIGIPPRQCRWNFGLGGKILGDDVPGRFCSGTLSWGGAPNHRWWIDRKAGVCGFLGTMIMPTGESRCVPLGNLFEEHVMKGLGKADA